MIRRPPRSTRTDTRFPYTTLFRSDASMVTATLTVRGALQSDPLCATFMRMAEKIWTELGTARAFGLSPGEETVTDNLLLGVQCAHPDRKSTRLNSSH